MFDSLFSIDYNHGWLVVGIIFILIDVIQLSGVGLLFLGFGALSTSIILAYYDLQAYQFSIFGISSFVWFMILYKPIQRFLHQTAGQKSYVKDIVGSVVVVVEVPLTSKVVGKVKWSGAIMRAILDPSVSDDVIVGTNLVVQSIKGNLLICTLEL